MVDGRAARRRAQSTPRGEGTHWARRGGQHRRPALEAHRGRPMTPRQRKAAAEALRVLADVLETEEASKPAPAPADAAEFVEVARAGIPPKTCRRLIKAGA